MAPSTSRDPLLSSQPPRRWRLRRQQQASDELPSERLQPPQPRDFEESLPAERRRTQRSNALPAIALAPQPLPPLIPGMERERPQLLELRADGQTFVSELSLEIPDDDEFEPPVDGSVASASSAADTDASVDYIRRLFPDVTDDHVISLLQNGSLNDAVNILAEESIRASSAMASQGVQSLTAPAVQVPPLDRVQNQSQSQTRARRDSPPILTRTSPSNSISERQGVTTTTTTTTTAAVNQVLEIFPSISESRVMELIREHSVNTAINILISESNS